MPFQKKFLQFLIWHSPVLFLINCGGPSAVFSSGAAISDSNATTSTTIPVAATSTTIPVAATSTTLPVATTSTTMPVAATSTTLPVATTSTTMPVATTSTSTTTTLPATTTTTTSTTMQDPNAFYTCEPKIAKYHPRHKHKKFEDEDEEEKHWGCAKEHKFETIDDDDNDDDNDDNSPHRHDIDACEHHKHKLSQPKPDKPDKYQCPANTYAKIRICHVPHGNPFRARTIHVSRRSLAAHLHKADYEGPCKDDYQGHIHGRGLLWGQWWKFFPLTQVEHLKFMIELRNNTLPPDED